GGPTRSPRQRRRHLLELNASVAGGRLRVDWHYSANRHERATVEAWAAAFVEALRSLVAHCLSAEAGGYTPSDFPLAGLDQGQIDRMVGRERGVEDIYPLSPIQQGLLFHSLYAPEEELYFLQTCCTLRGALDLPAFERAWQMVAARHPVLRTGFVWEGLAEPLQVVRASAALPVEAHDWRDVPAELLGERLRSFYAEDRARGFDLTRGPMMRLSLLRTGEDAHEVVWSHHHLIVDGWSCPLLLRECLTLYESLRRGEPSPLPRSRPYRDYIEWLRRQDLAAAERHWRELLKGFTAPTRVARGAAADPPESYGEQRRQLSEAATSAVQTYARRNKLTLNTVTLGAWAAVIGHLSGDEDVVFGTAVAGRPATLAGVERMVGVFINMLPLRARLAPDAPVASWLGGLQEQQLRMQQFEYSPLVRVQEWSDVPGGLPLFENFLVFENYWIGDGAPQGVRASLQVSDVRHLGRENYPLSVVVAPSSELTLKVKYNDPRLGARAAARILRRLEEALVAIAGRPGLGLRELRELLTEAEREEQAAEERKLREAQRQSFRRARRKAIGGAQAEETAHYEESTT
ncbi:MAG TPA: condensation domain-containing protein, partial [Pyrinomonadaceae bacterium]|nr:condensation domain-containing protein [Pyrinomonadaceae bacterium]